jgi:hypothetical protein
LSSAALVLFLQRFSQVSPLEQTLTVRLVFIPSTDSRRRDRTQSCETAPSAINVALTLPLTLLPCSPCLALQMLQLCWHDYPVGRSVMMTAMGLGVVLKLWLG